jgi:hypothetical protein
VDKSACTSEIGSHSPEAPIQSIKFSAKIVWRSEQRLEETRIDRGDQSDMLIAALAELLRVMVGKRPPKDKLRQLDAIVAGRGGIKELQKACQEHANHSPNRWQPFAYQAFSPYRTELLLLGRTLPLKAARPSANNLLEAVGWVGPKVRLV